MLKLIIDKKNIYGGVDGGNREDISCILSLMLYLRLRSTVKKKKEAKITYTLKHI